MQTQHITMTRTEARDLYRAYKKHRHWSQPIDRECMRAYHLLGQGRLVIKALESVVAAGLNEQGLPKLAICRADALLCHLRIDHRGGGHMRAKDASLRHDWKNAGNVIQSRSVIAFPAGSFAGAKQVWEAEALVPTPPLHVRPQRGLANYHILWEAEWTKIAPRDPYLLRRIGKADLWLVVAMWNLTEVERAALSTRITN